MDARSPKPPSLEDSPTPFGTRAQRWRIRVTRGLTKIGMKEEYFLVLVSIVIGAATGVFAHLFYALITYTHDLAYGDSGSGGLFSGRAWMLVVLPVAGATLVGLITHYFAREARGHGVPEVMDSLYREGGVIRPRVAGAKAVASALTIGSGGSAGMEGPIIQIGAAIGSTLGQFFAMPRRQMGVVVACGVSAGIGAIFNAPIAGVLFALEVFLKDFSFRTFSPVVFSSVISCSIMHALVDDDRPIFEVQGLRDAHYVFAGFELPLFLILGVLCAFASVAFIRLLYLTEDVADRMRIPDFVKPALGALALGLAGVICLVWWTPGQTPEFFGNGYAAIEMILGPGLFSTSVVALIALCLLKIVATSLTLGSGGSGGIFAPSLLMGASLGAAFGLTLRAIGIIDDSSVGAYALVGMAALVAGTTHAPLTAIVMLYEITREPKVILPVMFAAIVATFGAQLLLRDSIYTLKLRRRGVRVGSITDLTVLRRISADEVEHAPAQFVHPQDPLQKLIELAGTTNVTDFVVVDDEAAYQGMVTGEDMRLALLQPDAVALLVAGELTRTGMPTVRGQESLELVLDKFARCDVASLPMAADYDETKIKGIITRKAVLQRYQEELDRQSD